MTGLGARLKEARIAKGYTLDDLQDITKIQKRYLAGIESEDYSMMPGGFYVRVFIKQYAEAVDVEPDEMLALFKEENGSLAEQQKAEISPALQRSRALNPNSKLKDSLPQIIVALVIVAVIIVVYMLFRDKAMPDAEQPIDSEVPAIEQTEQSESGQTDTDQPAKQLELESTAGETSTFTLASGSKLELVVKTTGDSWIAVTDQNGTERMPAPGGRVMKSGETVEIDATDAASIRIRVGRTHAAELFVNGEKISYPTDRVIQNIIIQKP